MTNRDWLCLALRLLGIWILIQAAGELALYLYYFVVGLSGIGNLAGLASVFVWIIGRTSFALILILFAPAIATRFHPATSTGISNFPEFDDTKALKIGIQLLAVYALLLAIQAAAAVITGLLTLDRALNTIQFSNSSAMDENYLQSLLTFGLNLAFAAILLIWNDRVITLIEKFRYVPERDAYQPPPIEE